MIIVENEYQVDKVVLSAAPQVIYHNDTEGLPCVKTKLNFLPRRRLEECYTEHPDVSRLSLSTMLHLQFCYVDFLT